MERLTASGWLHRTNFEAVSYEAAVDNKDVGGVVVAVTNCPDIATVHNRIAIVGISHDVMTDLGPLWMPSPVVSVGVLTIEEAKQLVNRIGDAISVAERVAGIT